MKYVTLTNEEIEFMSNTYTGKGYHETLDEAEKKKLFRAVLSFSNRVRRAAGEPELKQLPSGRTRSDSHCPIARAVNCGFRVGTYTITATTRREKLLEMVREKLRLKKALGHYAAFENPPAVKEFVYRFDRGQFPEFDRTRKAGMERAQLVFKE